MINIKRLQTKMRKTDHQKGINMEYNRCFDMHENESEADLNDVIYLAKAD